MVCLALVAGFFSLAHADELEANAVQPLRVGFQKTCPLYRMDANGHFSGYLADYLDMITALTGQPFTCSFEDSATLLEKLRAGKLDIVGGLFPKESLGDDLRASEDFYAMNQQVLFADSRNAWLHYEDFPAFSGIKIGLMEDSLGGGLLTTLARKERFAFEPVLFRDSLRMREALEKGGVNAVVADIHNEHFSRIIAKLGNLPLHLYTLADRPELGKRIDAFQRTLYLNEPYFRARLELKHFGKFRRPDYAQTKAETLFVSRLPVLRVGCGPDNPPSFYYDAQNGTYRGNYVDFLHLVKKYSGLDFTIVQAKSHAECTRMLRERKADLYLGMFLVDAFASKYRLASTVPFTRVHMLIAGKLGTQVNRYAPQTLAITLAHPALPFYIQEHFPNWTVRSYDTVTECIDAVNRGVCDLVMQPEDAVFDLLAENPYPDIGIISSLSSEVPVVLGMRDDLNPLLLSVLNKAITAIDDSEYSRIAVRNEVMPIQFSRFWKLNRSSIEISCLAAVAFVIGLLVFFQYRVYSVAYRDRLTGLHNQNFFFGRTIKSAGVRKMPRKAVAAIEIANLRQINEYYGEETGNKVLVFVAATLRKHLSAGAHLFRLKGDSFLLISPYADPQVFLAFLEYLREHMRSYKDGIISTQLDFNIGVSLTGRDVRVQEAADRAELARREAKGSVGHLVLFNRKMEEELKAAKRVERNMEAALSNREFLVYYQPKFDLETRAVVGSEALVRWRTADGEFLRPDEFIPVFEQNGFIVRLDFHILDRVCARLRELLDLGITPYPVSVNQSRVHIKDPEYLAKLRAVMERYNLPEQLIELELTEYSFAEGDKILPLIAEIKKLGLSLSIDDFGSGFSSLNLLRELPINVLKIDKSFLAESGVSEKSGIIIRNIVRMSQDLHIENVCEGIEQEAQAAFLRSIGCRYGQGYLFSRPVPEEVFLRTYYGIELL